MPCRNLMLTVAVNGLVEVGLNSAIEIDGAFEKDEDPLSWTADTLGSTVRNFGAFSRCNQGVAARGGARR